jgi:hypothetical protein
MKKLIYYIITIFAFSSFGHSYAQISRGALPGEIYISVGWYYAGTKDYVAFFRSTDNGEHIQMQYSADHSIGAPMDDFASGSIYLKQVGALKVSHDYGVNWSLVDDEVNVSYISGYDSGEIYKAANYKLYRSTDYGTTFEVINSDSLHMPLADVGALPGEIYGLNGDAEYGYHLYHSFDYGNTYACTDIDSIFPYYSCEICRGTAPGEVYLIYTLFPSTLYNIEIYHSTDYGETFSRQYVSDYFEYGWWGMAYTAGREPGSFYIIRTCPDETLSHILLYIDYSNDYGKTFTTYFHDLLPDVSIEDKIVEVNQLFNLPNPFTSQTSVNFTLPKEAEININVTSLQGVMVKKIRLGKCTAGYHSYSLDGSDLPQGMYLCTLFADGEKVQTVKMIKAE